MKKLIDRWKDKNLLKYMGLSLCATMFLFINSFAQSVRQYNICWNTPSKNALESMPCGGNGIGLNVWVEKGELCFYFAQSGNFDENNTMLKSGRIRMKFSPDFLLGPNFKQILKLEDGSVYISGTCSVEDTTSVHIHLWVDQYEPVIHTDLKCSKKLKLSFSYENWRFADHRTSRVENNSNSYKWAAPDSLTAYRDSVFLRGNDICFVHHNKVVTVFDATVHEQSLDSVKNNLDNPLKNLTFGGMIHCKGTKFQSVTDGFYAETAYRSWNFASSSSKKNYELSIVLYQEQTRTLHEWKNNLFQLQNQLIADNFRKEWSKTSRWWKNFWKRSYVFLMADSTTESWEIGRNYQLFRFLLGCSHAGTYPVKFNGGLFTVDPCFVDSTIHENPDYRKWGGGTFTVQNQRLLYWPLLKSGDEDLLKIGFRFYRRLVSNASVRTKEYWQHDGCCFTEQLENFGLPNFAEYGQKRPENYDPGLQYNAWLEYLWDSSLEFVLMELEANRYFGTSLQFDYPFIKGSLTFFYEHYLSLAKRRGCRAFDQYGHLILYPGSACETYKMTYNSNSTIGGLKTLLEQLLSINDLYNLDDRSYWQKMFKAIPPISFREIDGHKIIAPALSWQRINNTESPQLYPIFPWHIYGVGHPDLDIARNTFLFDPDVRQFKDWKGWKQMNIFAACLGLTDDAWKITAKKLANSQNRFPVFWKASFDWMPDYCRGATGMIGLQEMLVQEAGKEIYLLPAWKPDEDVHFKLHLSLHTTVEAVIKNKKLVQLTVLPLSRLKDIHLPQWLGKSTQKINE